MAGTAKSHRDSLTGRTVTAGPSPTAPAKPRPRRAEARITDQHRGALTVRLLDGVPRHRHRAGPAELALVPSTSHPGGEPASTDDAIEKAPV